MFQKVERRDRHGFLEATVVLLRYWKSQTEARAGICPTGGENLVLVTGETYEET